LREVLFDAQAAIAITIKLCSDNEIYTILRFLSSQPENVKPRLPRITAAPLVSWYVSQLM
jgi:hypothetical protein